MTRAYIFALIYFCGKNTIHLLYIKTISIVAEGNEEYNIKIFENDD